MNKPIRVWGFYDAPENLQGLSQNGGDEDWLAEIPPKYQDEYISWLETPSFGCCCVDEYDHPTKKNWKVKIGSHA
jgi:hypothetical protein